jgi:predicted amidohydrolase
MELLDRACRERPDLVCLPEGVASFGLAGTPAELAETVPGPSTDEAARRACRYRTYVVCPVYRRDGDRVFNSAVIIDRQGQIAGIYDKMHLPNTSWRAFRERETPVPEQGITAGTEPGVFDLDFGRAGVQICFDLSYPNGWRQLADRGAELVIWPSAFGGGFHLRAAAYLNHYHVVSAVCSTRSRIVSPLGEVLEQTSPPCPVVATTVNLDCMVCYFDWHMQRLAGVKEKYGPDVGIRVLEEEGHFMIQSERDGLSVAELAREFNLMSSREYHSWLQPERTPAPPQESARRKQHPPTDSPCAL